MKKQTFLIPAVITCIFAAFTLGFFLGRNTAPNSILISTDRTAPIYAGTAPSEELPVSLPEETVSFPVNINTATAAELTALPGIGETLAQRITAYRTAHGDFPSVEELLNIEGIGEAKLEAILDLITTGG